MIRKSDFTFTLAKIREHRPCEDGWKKLLRGLGYTNGAHDPKHIVSLADVARINGAVDALWCLRCLDWLDIEVRRTVIRGVILPAAKRAAKHTTDNLVHDCIAAVSRWADGDDSVDLDAYLARAAAAHAVANAAAYAAARAAAYARAAADARAAGYVAAARAAAYARAAAAADTDERDAQTRDIIAMYESSAD